VRLGSIDGVRVVSAILVVFHHFPSVDKGIGGNRRILSHITSYQETFWGYVLLIPVGPGKIAVQTFLIMSGIVSTYPCWRTGTINSYEKSLLKRFGRLALPVLPVQLVHLILYSLGYAYGNFSRFPSADSVRRSYTAGISSIFASELNGALWVLPYFLFAPVVSFAVQYPALKLRPQARIAWYLLCLLYLGGNFSDEKTVSEYFSVVVGVILSDVFSNRATSNSDFLKVGVLISFATLFFPWLPGEFYAHKLSQVICAASFILLAQFWGPLNLAMDNVVMQTLSKYTYQLYIWHLVVLNTFAASVTPKASAFQEKLFVYVVAYLIVFVVAFVSYWIIEVPCGRMVTSMVRWFTNDALNQRGNRYKPVPVQV